MPKQKADKPVAKTMASAQLKSIVDRIEHLETAKKDISDDIREIYAEAKGNGYDVAALREVIRLRKMESDKRAEREAMVDLYRQALGMLIGTPLGDSAMEQATSH